MDQSRLDEIRARCNAATRGPWKRQTNRHPETAGELWGWIDGPREHYCWTDKRSRSKADADFIAAARTDIPDLLAEVERLTADLAAMTAKRDAMRERAEAAEDDLRMVCTSGETCAACRHCYDQGPNFPCRILDAWCGGEKWEWRGLREDEPNDTKEANHADE